MQKSVKEVAVHDTLAKSNMTAKAKSNMAAKSLVGTDCTLPEGATWCEVRLKNLPSYYMAVYTPTENPADKCPLSNTVCNNGYWEVDDPSTFGPVGNMLDIGGHIGYYSFAFANAGWQVQTFEPMSKNRALIVATMCQNPQLAQRINLNAFGLGSKTEECVMKSFADNKGDAWMECAGERPIFDSASGAVNSFAQRTVIEQGRFSAHRFEDALEELNIEKVDFVKIDVEGHELQVFQGAPSFLQSYQPRLVKSEGWMNMVGTDERGGEHYVNIFREAGYAFFKEPACLIPTDPIEDMNTLGTAEMFMCRIPQFADQDQDAA